MPTRNNITPNSTRYESEFEAHLGLYDFPDKWKRKYKAKIIDLTILSGDGLGKNIYHMVVDVPNDRAKEFEREQGKEFDLEKVGTHSNRVETSQPEQSKQKKERQPTKRKTNDEKRNTRQKRMRDYKKAFLGFING